MPRTRGGALLRFALAACVVVACAAATTAVAGLLEVNNIVDEFKLAHPIKIKGLDLPPPGAPQTLLLIGADHRYNQGGGIGNTDTMMLARIDDSSSTINLLSIPRDLEVTFPGGGIAKLNSIYSSLGPKGLLSVLKAQVFPGLQVNHILIVSFLGFARMIDAIGCVYTMVDHRYYNNTLQTDYSSIDIQPGYQRLCGDNAGANGALAFVRFRHTDSDLVREARQQDFIRWAKDGFSTSYLESNVNHLLKVFAENTQTDQSLDSTDGLINIANLVINANGHTLRSIPFPATGFPTIDGGQYVQSSPALEEQVYKAFITPTVAPHPAPASSTSTTTTSGAAGKGKAKPHKRAPQISTAGLIADPGDGRSQAAQLGRIGMQVYYPNLITSDSVYCFSVTGNCDESPNPPSAYYDSYPRTYGLRAPDGVVYPAYTFTLVINSALGDFYSVQGTTWMHPPILSIKPSAVQVIDGKTLYEYANGGKISLVAMRTSHGVYWISNTLEDVIPNSQMVAMAASFTPAP